MEFLIFKTAIWLHILNSLVFGNLIENSIKVSDPPCFFNLLCTCSKAYPDLGRVSCTNIPLFSVPLQINTSKVFSLYLKNNGIRNIPTHFFRQTGLYRIEISHNFLSEIEEGTFTGLEKSLWELNLQHNKFRKVPYQSFRYLQKLKLLDLSDNEITNIKIEDWLGMEDSLKTLILKSNKLSTLGSKTFSLLESLEILDLSKNSIFSLDNVFADGPRQLRRLNLADNLLSSFPFQILLVCRQLNYLDLSFNQMSKLQDFNVEEFKKPVSLTLDTLKLNYNQIQRLPFEFFKSFSSLNRIYLNGNPIVEIEKNTFKGSKIREIYLKNCKISNLMVDSLYGLENYLEVLDLEGNNLTTLPLDFFKNFNYLKNLNLRENFFKELDLETMFGKPQPSLFSLDLSGQQNSAINFEDFEMFPNLRFVSFSEMSQTSLPTSHLNLLFEFEELRITFSNIKNLKNHSFKNIKALKKLDLSDNEITTIQKQAFSEVAHSLVYLSLANGLSSDLTKIPVQAFENLTSLNHLDLSNNKLKVLPQKLFYSMKRVKIIQIQDNFIEFIPERAFQPDILSELKTIHFSFNLLMSIESQTFINLNNLENIWLNDNKISVVEKMAFMNLNKLKFLCLRRNKINVLKEESFQHLPELEYLDLSFNTLKILDYNSLDQVGTLSSFTLNVSHNSIERLISNFSSTNNSDFDIHHVSIKELDLSYNNLSKIEPKFFRPIESSIIRLDLSHNKLSNLTKNVFGTMSYLNWLDLSFNVLNDLEQDSFGKTKNIQVLYLSNNRLSEIPQQFFKEFFRLRVLDLSNNRLRQLSDNLFNDTIIQKLDVSDNRLTRIPINSFNSVTASTVLELDLSNNLIVALPSWESFAMFRNLHELNLSKNRIMRLENNVFAHLEHLRVLDLSHNAELVLDDKEDFLYGLDNSLEELILKNLSLIAIPKIRLDSLKLLDVSDNKISRIPFEVSHNLSHVLKIELKGNKISSMPPAINALNELEYLGISRNPLESAHFQQSSSLREIDLRNISLSVLEKGALGKLPLLEKLKLSVGSNMKNLNLPYLLKDNNGLSHLYVEVIGNEGDVLSNGMKGLFSPKLRHFTLVGRGVKTIPKNFFKGFQSPRLYFKLFNTSVTKIDEEVFENAENIRNLSLNVESNKLTTMHNPNTGDSPNTSKKTFLLDLEISDNNWICDCSIGWIEGWDRKRRQYLCKDAAEECFESSFDLHTVVCSNQKPKTVMNVFKFELECGWNSSRNLKAPFWLEIFLSIGILLLLKVNVLFF